MRPFTKKRATRNAEAKPFRLALLKRVGHCEICGAVPAMWWREPVQLEVHEIARGPHRVKAIDKAFAVLVVCRRCHDGPLAYRGLWPEARQLAALRRSRPADFDLVAFNALVGRGPNRVTEEEVAQWR